MRNAILGITLKPDENKNLMHAMETVFGIIYLFQLVLTVAAGVSRSDTNCWETKLIDSFQLNCQIQFDIFQICSGTLIESVQ